MKPFNYYSPVDIHFGEGITSRLGSLISGQYRKALLITAKGPFRDNGLHARVVSSLQKVGIAVIESPDIDSNPKISTIRESAILARDNSVDVVIALGGGSAMDAGKITAAAAAMNIDPWELLWGGRPDVDVSLPLITIPTIAATGTEVNEYAVAVDDDTLEKFYCVAKHPKMALLDPENTVTVPKNLTIWGAMDILSHTFEFYFNGDDFSETQKRFSESILLSTMNATEKLAADPSDVQARGELMWCAVLAWGGLTKIGRGDPDMTCHGIEESFSGYFDTHHGACLGVLTPLWMDLINQDVPQPFARFARNVMGVREDDDRKAAAEGVIRYRKWLKSVDAPARFADFGPNVNFNDEGLTTVAKNALRIYGGSVGRLKPLGSVDELLALMKAGRGDVSA